MEPVEESQAISEFQSYFQIKDFKTPCVRGFKVECFAWGSLWKSPLLLFLLKDGIIWDGNKLLYFKSNKIFQENALQELILVSQNF